MVKDKTINNSFEENKKSIPNSITVIVMYITSTDGNTHLCMERRLQVDLFFGGSNINAEHEMKAVSKLVYLVVKTS